MNIKKSFFVNFFSIIVCFVFFQNKTYGMQGKVKKTERYQLVDLTKSFEKQAYDKICNALLESSQLDNQEKKGLRLFLAINKNEIKFAFIQAIEDVFSKSVSTSDKFNQLVQADDCSTGFRSSVSIGVAQDAFIRLNNILQRRGWGFVISESESKFLLSGIALNQLEKLIKKPKGTLQKFMEKFDYFEKVTYLAGKNINQKVTFLVVLIGSILALRFLLHGLWDVAFYDRHWGKVSVAVAVCMILLLRKCYR